MTSIQIYYVLYFAFRDIVFSNVVSMGIKNLTLTHASQSCLIQHCKHSHWKYKKDHHYRILPKTWIMCKHRHLSLFLGVVVLLLWQSWWWHGSPCGGRGCGGRVVIRSEYGDTFVGLSKNPCTAGAGISVCTSGSQWDFHSARHNVINDPPVTICCHWDKKNSSRSSRSIICIPKV